jgi:hypothetical protein
MGDVKHLCSGQMCFFVAKVRKKIQLEKLFPYYCGIISLALLFLGVKLHKDSVLFHFCCKKAFSSYFFALIITKNSNFVR